MAVADSHCHMAETNTALQKLKKQTKNLLKYLEKIKKKEYMCKAHSQDLIIVDEDNVDSMSPSHIASCKSYIK